VLRRAFWHDQWRDAEPATRRKVLAHMRDFFRWLVRDDAALERNPCDFIRTPRKREPARGELFTGDERAAIFTANRASVTRRRSASSWTSPYGRARSGGSNSAITTWSRRRHCKGARAHTLPVPAGAQVILGGTPPVAHDGRPVLARGRGRPRVGAPAAVGGARGAIPSHPKSA
jgi:hypothetical protein